MTRRSKTIEPLADADAHHLLLHSVPACPLSSAQLRALETAIMMRVEDMVDGFVPTEFFMPPWMIGRLGWMRRGVVVTAVLLLALGVTAGRSFETVPVLGETPIAYETAMSWQNFMTTSAQEDMDEAAQ